MLTAHLSRINYYPFKSLDGQTVDSARMLATGALEHDRRFAILDGAGSLINGKGNPAVHRLHCEFDPIRRFVVLRQRPHGEAAGFHIDNERKQLEQWLGQYLDLNGPVKIVENATGGFPDDTEAPGPTVVSVATLEAVAAWFPGLTVDEVRARFRPNLEISGVPAFFEDQLFAEPDQVVRFSIGDVVLAGTNPCQRCVVPTRWSLTGEVGPDPTFTKSFSRRREETLPGWANRDRFDHYYRLAVNTCLARGGGSALRVGDKVEIVGTYPRQIKPRANFS